MKYYLSIIGISLLLGACGTQSQPVDTEPEKELSWEEEAIAYIMKIVELEEKNLELNMQELMENQEACKKYADENIGESGYNSEWQESHEHRYSPRFDRCFTLRDRSTDRGRKHIIYDSMISNPLWGSYPKEYQEQKITEGTSPAKARQNYPDYFEVQRIWEVLTKQ